MHSSLTFCPVFHTSSAVGLRSSDIWKFLFIYVYIFLCELSPANLAYTYRLCVLWEASSVVQGRGEAQCWAGFAQLETMSLKGTQTEPVSLRLQGDKGVLKCHPCSSQEPSHLSVLSRLNISEGLRQNLVLNLPNVLLLHLDPQRAAEL